jgi:hypothetical protein
MKIRKPYLAVSLALAAVLIWVLNYVRNGTNLWWPTLLALLTIILLMQQPAEPTEKK